MASSRLNWTLLGLLAVALGLLFYRSGTNPNFWFDESGQFWMAKGLNHYSAPYSPDGSVADALEANRKFNLDPGGYTLILRAWSELGTSPAWLRSLSFLFSLLTIAGFAVLGWLWGRKGWLAVLGGLVAGSGIVLARYSFELRAFSMEACGVAWSLVFLELFRDQKKLKFALFGGLVGAVMLTSRYSFLAPAFAVGLAYGVLLWPEAARRKLAVLTAYGLPILAMGALIYVGMLKPQNPGGDPPDYVRPFLLKGQSPPEMAKLIAQNLLLPGTLGGTVFAAAYLGRRRLRALGSELQAHRSIFVALAAATVLSALLSALGKYPWCGSHRWGISLSILSQAGLLAFTLSALRAAESSRTALARALPAIAVGVFGFGALACSWFIRYRSPDASLAILKSLDLAEFPARGIFVNYEGSATVRYHFEHGALRNSATGNYPDRFDIESVRNSNPDWPTFRLLVFGHASRDSVLKRLGTQVSFFEEIPLAEGTIAFRRRP